MKQILNGRRALIAGFFGCLLGLLQSSAQAQIGTPSLLATWNPSPDPLAVGYKVYYGVASGVYTNIVDVGSTTNTTVSGLTSDVMYYFTATAYDASGLESVPSNEVSASVPSTLPNQPPTLAALNNLSLNENAGPQTVNLAGITSGALNEVQTLTGSASSSNPGLIATPTLNYTSPNTTGTLVFTPAPNASGTALITVTVNDGGASNNIVTRAFTVTVNQVDQAPTITAIPNKSIVSGTSTGPIAFTLNDRETPAGNLILSAGSSNPTLIPVSKISFGGSNSSRTVILTPEVGQSGTATITVTVSDGTATANTSFQLVVTPRVLPPSALAVARP